MKILVLSDSHQHGAHLQNVVSAAARKGITTIIFLGDGYGDLDIIKTMFPVTVYAVVGNMDKGIQGDKIRMLDIEGYKILLIHGNQVGYSQDFTPFLQDRKIDILLYGHTHQQKKGIVKVNGRDVYVCNPGSIANGEYGILEVTSQSVAFEFKNTNS